MDILGPLQVVFIDQVMFPVAEKHDQKGREHHHPGKGVKNARHLWCTKIFISQLNEGKKNPNPLIAANIKQKATIQWLMRSGAL